MQKNASKKIEKSKKTIDDSMDHQKCGYILLFLRRKCIERLARRVYNASVGRNWQCCRLAATAAAILPHRARNGGMKHVRHDQRNSRRSPHDGRYKRDISGEERRQKGGCARHGTDRVERRARRASPPGKTRS